MDERDATKTLVDRGNKVVKGKGVEFSIIPKNKVTWKTTAKTKSLTPKKKSAGKATRTNEDEAAEDEAGTPTIEARAQKPA